MIWIKAALRWIWDTFKVAWPLWGATIVTAGFARWVYLLANEVTIQEPYRATRWEHFLHGRPNELGDTLAGFVGSLTLIWVVASVIQQSMELKAQRTEFKKMVEAQDAQVKAFDAQLALSEDQKKQREMEGLSKVLDALLANLARQCEMLNLVATWEFYLHEDDYSGMSDEHFMASEGPHKESMKPFGDGQQDNLDERVHQHSKSLMIFYIALMYDDRHLRCCKKVKRDFFLPLPELIDQITAQAKDAGKDQRVRIASLGLDDMKSHLVKLQGLDLWKNDTDIGATP